MFARAVKAGGKSQRAVANQFYGDRMGTLEDPFGHVWTIGTHIEDVAPEEMKRRVSRRHEAGRAPRFAGRSAAPHAAVAVPGIRRLRCSRGPAIDHVENARARATLTASGAAGPPRGAGDAPAWSSTRSRSSCSSRACSRCTRCRFAWTVKKVNLLIASYLFYAAWNPPFVILLWISTVVDWYAAQGLVKAAAASARGAPGCCCRWSPTSACSATSSTATFLLDNFTRADGAVRHRLPAAALRHRAAGRHLVLHVRDHVVHARRVPAPRRAGAATSSTTRCS